ncbi:MAG: hypothetical protein R2940_15505 [Syntrophotaleaceae bacterium]
MRLNVAALAVTAALVWSLSVFLVGISNLLWPPYGQAFLELAASIYPGYHAEANFGSVIVGTLYALVDGAVVGAVFAWIYNLVASRSTP